MHVCFVAFPKVYPRLVRNEPGIRLREYRHTIVEQWVLCLSAVGIWLYYGRPLYELGLGFKLSLANGIGLMAVGLFTVLLWLQYRAVQDLESARQDLDGQLGEKVKAIVPHTQAEAHTFRFVGLTAGICEEVLFRGFLMAYLQQWMDLWAAVGVSSIAFMLAHSYMGRSDAIRAGIFGLACGIAYALTGSLVTPILLHAIMDIFSGATLYAAFRDQGPAQTIEALDAGEIA